MLYTNPAYQGPGGIKELQAKEKSYDDALNQSQELKRVREQLLARYNTFTVEEREKLEDFLPDNVDNIRLVIDINNIAARHSLSVKNLQLGDTKDGAAVRSDSAVGTPGGAVGTVELGFTITADYDNFLAFLSDLEHSLRLVDVERITFSVGEKTTSDYSFTIRTYWLH